MRLGNRYARERGFSQKLRPAYRIQDGARRHRGRCKQQPVLYPTHFSERFGANCPAIELREHIRCTSS